MNDEITALVDLVERWQRSHPAAYIEALRARSASGVADEQETLEYWLLTWRPPAASRPAPAPHAWPDCPDCGAEVLAWSDTVDGSSGAHCTGCGREFFAPLAAPAPAVGEAERLVAGLEDMRHGRVQSLAEIDAALASPAPQPADGVTQAQHEIVASIIDMVEHDQSRRAEMNRLRADALRAVLARALASPAPQPVAPAPVWHGCKAGGAVCARYKPTGIGCAEGECDLASGVWAAPAPVEPPDWMSERQADWQHGAPVEPPPAGGRLTLAEIQRKLHIGTAQAMRVQAALYGRGSCRDRTCPKVKHLGSGYLHAEDDDSPYDVDGVRYCGRCHMVMDTPPPAKGKE